MPLGWRNIPLAWQSANTVFFCQTLASQFSHVVLINASGKNGKILTVT
jgi:hypothetical protein